VRVGTDVVSVMAAYSDLVCLCMVQCAKKYWTILPDDGSCVNRNMLDRLL